MVAATVAVAAGPATAADQHEPTGRDRLEEVGVEEQALLDQLEATEQTIAALDAEITAITAREQEVTARLAEAQEQVEEATAAERRAEAELDRQRRRLRAQAIDAYVTGQRAATGRAEILAVLDSSAPLDVSVINAYGGSVVENQDQVVTDFERAEAALARARRRADDRRDAVLGERRALAAELARRTELRAQQDQQRIAQEGLLAEVSRRRAEIEADVAAEAADSDAIGAEIAQAQRGDELALPLPGTLVWLVPDRPEGEYSSPFGIRHHPILGTDRLHKGVDIGCTTGDPIVAVAAGTVLVAAVRGGYGNAVVIDHGGQFATLYAHNSALEVVPGDVVAAGQPIATCGSSGLSTGPHSHFETRVNGAPIDPATFI